jgi:hypothetical protein
VKRNSAIFKQQSHFSVVVSQHYHISHMGIDGIRLSSIESRMTTLVARVLAADSGTSLAMKIPSIRGLDQFRRRRRHLKVLDEFDASSDRLHLVSISCGVLVPQAIQESWGLTTGSI